MLDVGRRENTGTASVAVDSITRAMEPGACMEQGGRDLRTMVTETAEPMAATIRALSGSDLAMLQAALRQLNLDQFDFVYDVLESEVAQGRMTRNEFRRFESFVDRWWTHDLAMKLAFLHRVCGFGNLCEWPAQFFPELQRLRIPYGVTPCAKDGRELR